MTSDPLSVTDNRTGASYEIPIADGAIKATELRQIKLSDDDFVRLQAKYQAEALEVLREVDAAKAGAASPAGATADGDAVERLIAEARAQARSRQQRFCEECGTPLEVSGRFCVGCGTPVGAAS